MSGSTQGSRNLVIVGGGFAGTVLAKRLERRLDRDWEIYLLSRDNIITYNPLLPEVVGASVMPGHVVAPLRQMLKRTRMRMVEVQRIDTAERRVHYRGEVEDSLRYDQLVLACGVGAELTQVDGMAEHGLPLKTVGDALEARNRAVVSLEQATIHPDPAHRAWLTTFAVVGGGFSGVEVAAELHDFLQSSARYYKNVRAQDCRVVLLHGTERLLPELTPTLGRYTERLMTRRGIEVHTSTRVARVDAAGVYLEDGTAVPAATVICTVGTAPHGFTEDLALPKSRGRIVTAGDMSVAGFPGVWALGDCAVVPNAKDGERSPPTAQFADRQGRQLATNLVRSLHGKPTRPFSYRPIGQLASVGHNKAVAEVYGVRLSGFIAFLMWRGTYLLKIPTLARKTRLFLEWNWAMFFPPDIAHMGFDRSRHRKGRTNDTTK